ncbi:hypothetical protein F7725_024925 [Dissostichus mawsoni]|uniref:Uncharacterized protein n=1 Tax=Dissostichus mawsoni TaxID=36200 RepID=A0A7J5X9W5_DISMA|nr:hypothetical protein F7725_024925 [Dissostichus mawsoni]
MSDTPLTPLLLSPMATGGGRLAPPPAPPARSPSTELSTRIPPPASPPASVKPQEWTPAQPG